jgi:hypothetical protein
MTLKERERITTTLCRVSQFCHYGKWRYDERRYAKTHGAPNKFKVDYKKQINYPNNTKYSFPIKK